MLIQSFCGFKNPEIAKKVYDGEITVIFAYYLLRKT